MNSKNQCLDCGGNLEEVTVLDCSDWKPATTYVCRHCFPAAFTEADAERELRARVKTLEDQVAGFGTQLMAAKRLGMAVEAFRSGRLSSGRAAAEAGVSRADLLLAAGELGVNVVDDDLPGSDL